MKINFGIVLPDAISNPVAVVVHQVNALLASFAMIIAFRLDGIAYCAFSRFLLILFLTI
jgi:hypothetical protein